MLGNRRIRRSRSRFGIRFPLGLWRLDLEPRYPGVVGQTVCDGQHTKSVSAWDSKIEEVGGLESVLARVGPKENGELGAPLVGWKQTDSKETEGDGIRIGNLEGKETSSGERGPQV